MPASGDRSRSSQACWKIPTRSRRSQPWPSRRRAAHWELRLCSRLAAGAARCLLHPTFYLNGQTAEAIAQAFPLLTLEQVYGALAWYLAHREAIDAHLRQGAQDYECLRQATRDADPIWYLKLDQARRSAA